MTKLIINPKTKQNIDYYLKNPSHAVLLHGQKGLGVDIIALNTARILAGNQLLLITPDEKGKIGIEVIRKDVLRIISNRQNDPFAVVINDADTMTISAQNTLLKVLEEPVNNVYFILSAHQIEKLLPTIQSRVQLLEIMPVPAADTEIILKNAKITADKRTKISFLAGGKPAETMRLLDDEMYYREMATVAENAKRFISGNTYERLIIISGIKKREEAKNFVQIISNLILFLIKTREIASLSENLEVLSTVADNLAQNGNTRAQMTYLACHFE